MRSVITRVIVLFLLGGWLFGGGVVSAETVAGRHVELVAGDGYHLAGILSGGDRRPVGGVVLLHMYRSNKESWQPLVDNLVERGFVCLAIDMRGHGESRFGVAGEDNELKVLARDPVFFNKMHLDAEAAVRYLVDGLGVSINSIALVGASVGCSVAIHTIVTGKVDVSVAVLMTPGKNYLGVPTMEHLRKWPGVPLLILSSWQEKQRGAEAIFYSLPTDSSELELFDQKNIHGTRMFGVVGGVEDMIGDWLTKKLVR